MPGQQQIRCVHCGEALAKETADHVFPKSWYPDTTDPEVQRWTVPSCDRCNNKLGALEKAVFSRLALCVDPRKQEAAGIAAKVRRSMGIGVEGLAAKEAEHRRALKLKIIGATTPYKAGSETLPGLGPHMGFPEDELHQIGIPAGPLIEVAKKIVRGCEYVLTGRIVDEPYDVEIYFVLAHEVPDQLLQALGSPNATQTHLGPGFSVTRVAAHDEPNSVIYKIVLWDTLVIYASILPRLKQDDIS